MKKIFKPISYFLITAILLLHPFFALGTTAATASGQSSHTSIHEENTVQLSIVISEEENEIPLPLQEIDIEEGDTVLDALIKAAEANQIPLSYTGEGESAYVEGIDGVYEFERGPGSGWMYRVNGIFPNRGAGVISLVPGDRVEWLYTTNLGQDLGANLQPFRDNLEPSLRVEGITNNDTIYEKELNFYVEAKSYFGTILSPTVKVNDVEASPLKGNHFSAELEEGENVIEITAVDKKGRITSETYTIVYEEIVEEEQISVEPAQDEVEEIADESEQIASAIEKASSYILENGVDSEWEAIGLARAGKEVPNEYVDIFYQNVEDQIANGLENGRIKITDIERLAIAAVAIGLDPRDLAGHNLIELIYNSPERRGGYDTMTFQGNNGLIFALIALDTLKFAVPDEAKWTRQELVDELLRTQNEDGSWALNEMFDTPSVDITGMALIGLSPYKHQPQVREALDKAVEWLSSVQTDNGGFDGGDFVGGITSEAAAQVIIGLSAYGVDPTGEQFTKNGNNLITHFLEFQNQDGGFKHTMDYDYSDAMSTEQALQALVAYDFFLKGKGNLYHFGENNREEETPGDGEEPPVDEDTEGEEETPGDGEEPPVDEDTEGEEETPGDGDAEDGKDIPGEDETSEYGEERTPSAKTQSENGSELPNTATNFYNFMLIGVMVIAVGGLLFYIQVKRRTEEISSKGDR